MTETPLTTGESSHTVSAWALRLAGLLQALTGLAPAIRKVAASRVEADPGGGLWWRNSGDQTIWIGMSAADADALARVSQPGPAPAPKEAVSVFIDLLDRSWGQPGEILTEGPVQGAPNERMEVYECRFEGGETVHFLVTRSEPVLSMPSNLDALMDIELPLTLRFGSTRMALQDIVGLNTGSIIELDRSLDDPVDVMVNGHVVARGEAVTVQGVYGIRISEITSRRERLTTTTLEPAAEGGSH